MSYFKPNTKKAIKLAISIKTVAATLGTYTAISGSPWVALIIAAIGAIANEAINFFSDGTEEIKNT